jgi:hypothetical protein
MAVLDGGIDYGNGSRLTYDFDSSYPGSADIRRRSLSTPDFRFTMEARYVPHLEISADVEALVDLPQQERILHVIVLEKQITDPDYTGTNGSTRFYNVARKMLPDAAGTLFDHAWSEGQVESIQLTWENAFFPLLEDSLCIVAYLQDENTGEILQAACIPEYSSVSSPELPESRTRVLLYPNPAGETVNLYFEEMPQEALWVRLYALSGQLMLTDRIQPWQQLYSLLLDGLERGLYLMEIRSVKNRRILFRDKLIHY